MFSIKEFDSDEMRDDFRTLMSNLDNRKIDYETVYIAFGFVALLSRFASEEFFQPGTMENFVAILFFDLSLVLIGLTAMLTSIRAFYNVDVSVIYHLYDRKSRRKKYLMSFALLFALMFTLFLLVSNNLLFLGLATVLVGYVLDAPLAEYHRKLIAQKENGVEQEERIDRVVEHAMDKSELLRGLDPDN